jgi:hypothetical protein
MLTQSIDSQFKASTSWLYGFMRRFNLTLRMPTSTSLLSSDDISQRVHSFKDYYTQLYSGYQIDNLINVDQTPPVWWNGMTSNTRTVAVKNQRSIYTRCPTAANSREKVSVT